MPRVCPLCDRLQRAEIEQELARGTPVPLVVVWFGLRGPEVHKHRRGRPTNVVTRQQKEIAR